MKIFIKLFASHREIVGDPEIEIVLPEDATVNQLIDSLFNKYPKLEEIRDETIVSINKMYADENSILKDNDEVALFPPVGGG